MKEFFRPNTIVHREQGKEIHEDVVIPDNELIKEPNLSAGEFEYFKYITIDGTRYILFIQRSKENIEGEAEIHFSLADSVADPITNAGLEVFGKIATEIEGMYQEVNKTEQIDQFKILAAKDSHSLLDEQRIAKLSQSDLLRLEGFRYIDTELGISIEIHGQLVSVVYAGGKHKIIALRPQLLTDLEQISPTIDERSVMSKMVQYLNQKTSKDLDQLEKELQRLKLYQFYFQKRYPQFTFNSKITTGSDGKRTIEFEKDEEGRPYLVVFTNTDRHLNDEA